MNAKDFIITRLKVFLEDFKEARVRYECDSATQTHTIEVVPQSVFDSQEFLDWECGLYDEFSLEYPGEIIGFISEDALVGIEKVDFEGEGSLYGSFTINPSFVFSTTIAEIQMSATKLKGTSLSVSDFLQKDPFEETFVDNHEFLNNYKFAA